MSVDVKTAVDSLQAAKDVSTLKEAIAQALFLDAVAKDRDGRGD